MRKIILRKGQDGKIEKVATPLDASGGTAEIEPFEKIDTFNYEDDALDLFFGGHSGTTL